MLKLKHKSWSPWGRNCIFRWNFCYISRQRLSVVFDITYKPCSATYEIVGFVYWNCNITLCFISVVVNITLTRHLTVLWRKTLLNQSITPQHIGLKLPLFRSTLDPYAIKEKLSSICVKGFAKLSTSCCLSCVGIHVTILQCSVKIMEVN
jgi:hypothetical protein